MIKNIISILFFNATHIGCYAVEKVQAQGFDDDSSRSKFHRTKENERNIAKKFGNSTPVMA